MPRPPSGSSRFAAESDLLTDVAIADVVAIADARDPVALSTAVEKALGAPADVTVVCVDVPGCEHGAILATSPEGGTVIFFSMATSFTAAALGAEGLAADTTMLIGNGYTPGHAEYAFDLLRRSAGVRDLFTRRLAHEESRRVTTTLFRGGRVYSTADPFATALVVEDDVVAWVGTDGAAACPRRECRCWSSTSTTPSSRRRSWTRTCTPRPPACTCPDST